MLCWPARAVGGDEEPINPRRKLARSEHDRSVWRFDPINAHHFTLIWIARVEKCHRSVRANPRMLPRVKPVNQNRFPVEHGTDRCPACRFVFFVHGALSTRKVRVPTTSGEVCGHSSAVCYDTSYGRASPPASYIACKNGAIFDRFSYERLARPAFSPSISDGFLADRLMAGLSPGKRPLRFGLGRPAGRSLLFRITTQRLSPIAS